MSAAAGAALLLGSAVFGVTTSAPAGAANNTPLTVGIICSCTGPLASSIAVGPPAFQAWASYQNARGGLNGHKVTVILKDDQSNPGTALADVQDMVNNSHITMLVDDSQGDTAFSSFIDQSHIPVIGGGSQSDVFLTDPNWFAPGQTVDNYFINYMKAAQKVGVKNIAQLYCAESTICQQGVPSFKAAAAASNITVGYLSQISFAAPSYAAQCIASKQAGVGMINVADALTVAIKVANDCQSQGYQPWYVALDGAVGLQFLTTPALNNHFIGSQPDIPFTNTTLPAMKTYNAALKKYAAAATINNPNYNEESTQNWISGLMLAKAVQNVNAGSNGPITAQQIFNGLYAFHDETLGGMTPLLNFHKGVPNLVDCWFWIKVQGGKFTTPYGLAPACSKSVVAK